MLKNKISNGVEKISGNISADNFAKGKAKYKVLQDADMSYEFSRSSGPGGQKVNKTSSKVTLRLNLNSNNFTDEEREKIKAVHSNRITNDGCLIVHSQTSRSQKINKEAAKERAEILINEALLPKEARVDTKIPKSQKEERLREKKIKSLKKELRTKPDF